MESQAQVGAQDPRSARRPAPGRPLRRSRKNRLVGGVCGGIADFISADVRVVRIVYALSALPSIGFTLVGYLLLWLLLPSEPAATA